MFIITIITPITTIAASRPLIVKVRSIIIAIIATLTTKHKWEGTLTVAEVDQPWLNAEKEVEKEELDDFPLPTGTLGPLSSDYVTETAQRAGQMLRKWNQGGGVRCEVEAMRIFGLQVRASRQKRGISYTQLAQHLGLTEDFLIFLESGLISRKEVNDAFLKSLAQGIGEDFLRLRQIISSGEVSI